MGNSDSQFSNEEILEEEVQRCSGSCTSIEPMIQRNRNYYNRNYQERDVVLNELQVWKNGIIPYELDYNLDYNKHRILKAMRTIEKFSRLRFEERSYQKTYLKINKEAGCQFMPGYGKRQPRVSLGTGCDEFGTILHELMHAIGFPHEQRRPDRDDYITIHWENISKGNQPQFWRLKKYEYTLWSEFPFDYNSIMLYEEYAFSKNGYITIESLNGRPIHRKTNLSEIDKVKLGSL